MFVPDVVNFVAEEEEPPDWLPSLPLASAGQRCSGPAAILRRVEVSADARPLIQRVFEQYGVSVVEKEIKQFIRQII